eukprot:gene4007-4638_t
MLATLFFVLVLLASTSLGEGVLGTNNPLTPGIGFHFVFTKIDSSHMSFIGTLNITYKGFLTPILNISISNSPVFILKEYPTLSCTSLTNVNVLSSRYVDFNNEPLIIIETDLKYSTPHVFSTAADSCYTVTDQTKAPRFPGTSVLRISPRSGSCSYSSVTINTALPMQHNSFSTSIQMPTYQNDRMTISNNASFVKKFGYSFNGTYTAARDSYSVLYQTMSISKSNPNVTVSWINFSPYLVSCPITPISGNKLVGEYMIKNNTISIGSTVSFGHIESDSIYNDTTPLEFFIAPDVIGQDAPVIPSIGVFKNNRMQTIDIAGFIYNPDIPIIVKLRDVNIYPGFPFGIRLGNTTSFTFAARFILDSKAGTEKATSATVPVVNDYRSINLGAYGTLVTISVSCPDTKIFRIVQNGQSFGKADLVSGDDYNGIYEYIVEQSSPSIVQVENRGMIYNELTFNPYEPTVSLFKANSMNVTGKSVPNVLYFNVTDMPASWQSFKPRLQLLIKPGNPVPANPTFEGWYDITSSLFVIPFVVPMNIFEGTLDYIIRGYPDITSAMLKRSHPSTSQLDIQSNYADLKGPLITSVTPRPSSDISVTTNFMRFGWDLVIEDYPNGFKEGYVNITSDRNPMPVRVDLVRKSGDMYNGTYEVRTDALLPGISQTYTFSAWLKDTAGNEASTILRQDTTRDGVTYALDKQVPYYSLLIRVLYIPQSDDVPPQLYLLNPYIVSDTRVKINFEVSDTNDIRIDIPPFVYITSIYSTYAFQSTYNLGNRSYSQFSVDATLPYGFGGENISIAIYGIYDKYLNSRGYSTEELQSKSLTSQVLLPQTSVNPLLTSHSTIYKRGGQLTVFGKKFFVNDQQGCLLELMTNTTGPAVQSFSLNTLTIDIKNLQWMQMKVNDKTMYGRFFQKGIIDNRVRSVTSELITTPQSSATLSSTSATQSLIGINIPYFLSSAILDPDLSLLIDSDAPSTCSKSKLTPGMIAGIVAGGAVFIFAIAVVVAIIIRRKYKIMVVDKKIKMDVFTPILNISTSTSPIYILKEFPTLTCTSLTIVNVLSSRYVDFNNEPHVIIETDLKYSTPHVFSTASDSCYTVTDQTKAPRFPGTSVLRISPRSGSCSYSSVIINVALPMQHNSFSAYTPMPTYDKDRATITNGHSFVKMLGYSFNGTYTTDRDSYSVLYQTMSISKSNPNVTVSWINFSPYFVSCPITPISGNKLVGEYMIKNNTISSASLVSFGHIEPNSIYNDSIPVQFAPNPAVISFDSPNISSKIFQNSTMQTIDIAGFIYNPDIPIIVKFRDINLYPGFPFGIEMGNTTSLTFAVKFILDRNAGTNRGVFSYRSSKTFEIVSSATVPVVNDYRSINLGAYGTLVTISVSCPDTKIFRIVQNGQSFGKADLVSGDDYNGIYEYIVEQSSPSIVQVENRGMIYNEFSFNPAYSLKVYYEPIVPAFTPKPLYISTNPEALSISFLVFKANSMNVTGKSVPNVLYFNVTDMPASWQSFKPRLQLLIKPGNPDPVNPTFEGWYDITSSLFVIPFVVPMNIFEGTLDYIIHGYPDITSAMLKRSHPTTSQLDIQSNYADLKGPLITSVDPKPFATVILNNYKMLGWDLVIEDYPNGFKEGYFNVTSDRSPIPMRINLVRNSGDMYNGTYQVRFDALLPGVTQTYTFSAWLMDNAGNVASTMLGQDNIRDGVTYALAQQQAPPTINAQYQVPQSDYVPPQLLSLDANPLSDNLIRINIQFTDDNGIRNDIPPFVYITSIYSTYAFQSSYNFGNATFSKFSVDAILPYGFGGEDVFLSLYGIYDRFLNTRGYSTEELQNKSFIFKLPLPETSDNPILKSHSTIYKRGGQLTVFGNKFFDNDQQGCLLELMTSATGNVVQTYSLNTLTMYGKTVLSINIPPFTSPVYYLRFTSQGGLKSNILKVNPTNYLLSVCPGYPECSNNGLFVLAIRNVAEEDRVSMDHVNVKMDDPDFSLLIDNDEKSCSPKSKLTPGMIAGIVVGSALFIFIIVATAVILVRRKYRIVMVEKKIQLVTRG